VLIHKSKWWSLSRSRGAYIESRSSGAARGSLRALIPRAPGAGQLTTTIKNAPAVWRVVYLDVTSLGGGARAVSPSPTHAVGVRRAIGYVPQAVSVDGSLTGYENLLIFAKLYDLPGR